MHTTALVALFRGVGQPFEINRQSLAAPSEDNVLVRVMLATICGSDLAHRLRDGDQFRYRVRLAMKPSGSLLRRRSYAMLMEGI